MSVEKIIKDKIEQSLKIHHLEVINDSARHHGHAGDDGSGETHFNLLVVSDDFVDVSRVQRQRLVNDLLSDLLKGPVHALSMKCMSVSEYKKPLMKT
ncbi:MAG: BolA family transcriptional regulator [Alphaproteobacteria bacterium]|nr:BolA family transcriptional regulator [Alphaproteobacteria bacterium]